MPLRLQNHSSGQLDDYEVFSGQAQVGRIYKRTALTPNTGWLWALNGVLGGPRELAMSGSSGTQAEALAALEDRWDKWLGWINLRERT
jgi:hypothetical protein